MSFTFCQKIVVVNTFFMCGILWAMMCRKILLQDKQSLGLLVCAHPRIARCAVPTLVLVWTVNQIREPIQLRNNPPKKPHQLDLFPILNYSLHKNSGADAAQGIVTIQDGTIAETFVFGLHPYV